MPLGDGVTDPDAALSRVLIVDDEPDIRLVVRLGLEAAGLRVAVAGSAAEAIEVAAVFAPELVLLDVEMPGVDGVAALEQLRHVPACAGARTAFLTARADLPAVDVLRQLDVLAVLIKPVDPLRLPGLLRLLWAHREQGCEVPEEYLEGVAAMFSVTRRP